MFGLTEAIWFVAQITLCWVGASYAYEHYDVWIAILAFAAIWLAVNALMRGMVHFLQTIDAARLSVNSSSPRRRPGPMDSDLRRNDED